MNVDFKDYSSVLHALSKDMSDVSLDSIDLLITQLV